MTFLSGFLKWTYLIDSIDFTADLRDDNDMNKDEIIAREEHRANWQEEARARANQEGLTGDEAIKRALEIYEELREIGEGI